MLMCLLLNLTFRSLLFDWLPLQQALLEIFLEDDGWSLMAGPL